jgi:flagellar biosynthesis protein FlhF
MADALNQVKKHFGRDAVILNTRTLTEGGWLGIGGRQVIEITAAPEWQDLPQPRPRGRLSTVRSGRGVGAEGAAQTVASRATHPAGPDGGALLAEVGQLKSMVSQVLQETRQSRAPQVPEPLVDSYHKLVENEVAQRLAEQLIARVQSELDAKQLADARTVKDCLARGLEQMLPAAGPIHVAPSGEPQLIALVGPTGVGKTTTVAKLAANFCLREQRKVGLITVDTYRIGAVEQLKTYAQIINVPLEVVTAPEELNRAVTRMADRDVVLIDTAGRSQRDQQKLDELNTFFAKVRPHEVHLVLSTTCGQAVLTETIQRFQTVGVDRVIFTKLDESLGFGVILNCLEQVNARLSYVTTGQDVPDDIEVGEGRFLARLILEGNAGASTGAEVTSRAGAGAAGDAVASEELLAAVAARRAGAARASA